MRQNAHQLADLVVHAIDELRAVRDQNGGGLLAWRPEREVMARLVPSGNQRPW